MLRWMRALRLALMRRLRPCTGAAAPLGASCAEAATVARKIAAVTASARGAGAVKRNINQYSSSGPRAWYVESQVRSNIDAGALRDAQVHGSSGTDPRQTTTPI